MELADSPAPMGEWLSNYSPGGGVKTQPNTTGEAHFLARVGVEPTWVTVEHPLLNFLGT